MGIKYKNRRNQFKKGTYYPQVVKGPRVKMKTIMNDILRETALTESEVYGVMSAMRNRFKFYLQQGMCPEIDDLVSFSISIHDNLPDANASLSSEAKLSVEAKVSGGFQTEVLTGLEKERVPNYNRLPTVISLFDGQSETENVYTAGKIARLNGADLKFDKTNLDEGIFFISLTDGAEVRADLYLDIGSTRISFSIPDGLSGEQRLEVRSYMDTQILRTGQIKEVLTPATPPAP